MKRNLMHAKRQNVVMRYGMSSEFPFSSSTNIIHPSTCSNAIDSERCSPFRSIKLSECFSGIQDLKSFKIKESKGFSRNFNRRYNTDSAGRKPPSRSRLFCHLANCSIPREKQNSINCNKTIDSKLQKMLKLKFTEKNKSKVQSVEKPANSNLIEISSSQVVENKQRKKILKHTIYSPINGNLLTMPNMNIENQIKKSVNFKNESKLNHTLRTFDTDVISTQCNTQIFKMNIQSSPRIITKDVKSKISTYNRFF